jgi:hypothetical protein
VKGTRSHFFRKKEIASFECRERGKEEEAILCNTEIKYGGRSGDEGTSTRVIVENILFLYIKNYVPFSLRYPDKKDEPNLWIAIGTR